ncbi:MAG: IS110 family transposase [Actinomycetes bacterium]
MQVIGVDPHKGSHTAVAIGADESVIQSVRVEASRRQVDRLVVFAADWPERVWAVECAAGVGRMLAQQLVARGERVLDVPPALSTRVRVLSGRSGRKTDAHDARAVAIVALRNPNLVEVSVEDFSRGLRLLSDRRGQLVASRAQAVTRLHSLLAELLEGGAPQSLTAEKATVILRRIHPVTDVDAIRKDLARELLEDIKRLDARLAANAARIAEAVTASGTTLTDIPGVGPVTAAKIIGHTGMVGRFPTRGHYASYAGTAPIEASSGEVERHRLSRRGNRQLNSALHGVAITQMRHPGPGRDLYDRKIAAGKARGEARRALKRHITDRVYSTLVAGAQRSPGRQVGATLDSSAAGQSPTANTSERSVPGLRKQATTDAA